MMTTTQIDWVQGDTPLPLHVNADITSAAVVTTWQDLEDPDAVPVPFTYHAGDGAAGDFTVTGAALSTPGVYRLVTVVTQGTTEATFPKPGILILNVTPDGAGISPTDELDSLLANLPGYVSVSRGMKQVALNSSLVPDAAGVWPGNVGYVTTYDVYFAALGILSYLQALPVVRSSSSEGTSVAVDAPNWAGLGAYYRSMSPVSQATSTGLLGRILIPDGPHVTATDMSGRFGYGDVDTDLG